MSPMAGKGPLREPEKDSLYELEKSSFSDPVSTIELNHHLSPIQNMFPDRKITCVVFVFIQRNPDLKIGKSLIRDLA